MVEYDEEEDWESYEDTLFGLTSHQLGGILNVIMWLIGAGLLLWLALAILSPKPKGSTKELYAANVDHFKAKSVEEGTGGHEGGVLSSVAHGFKRVLNLEATPRPAPAVRHKAAISCVPFGCPEPRMTAGFAIDQNTGAAFLYGGFDEKREGGGFLQDLHYYDTGKFQWKRVSGNKGHDDVVSPGKRVHVRMACNNKLLCLYGGSTEVRSPLTVSQSGNYETAGLCF